MNAQRSKTTRMTAAEALVRFLAAQSIEDTAISRTVPLFAGVFAIFGHGNVTGLGEALYQARGQLTTWRAHNEQSMAHTAIAFAKAHNRRRMMACTTSVGPGATNMLTAAALAHVNRLPVLLLPGDTFANRRPDPVLQQLEVFSDATVSVNDCFKPVSRFWDRITRPEQLLQSLPRALQTLLDPVDCGPVTLAFPQDVQTEAYDYPDYFFAPTTHAIRRPRPDEAQVQRAIDCIRRAQKPLVIAGGGVHYAHATKALQRFASSHGIPVAETQAGKSALPWDHPCNVGSIGVTGSTAANHLASQADVVLAIGTRLSDFTTASRSLFQHPNVALIQLNVAPFDAHKDGAIAVIGDAAVALDEISSGLTGWQTPQGWQDLTKAEVHKWHAIVDTVTQSNATERPSDAAVIGAVNRAAGAHSVVVCAAGGLPGELHKLWRSSSVGGYHVEYGFSCMGYEIAGGLGVKMACPERDVYVMVGDGSYLMLNSEIATSIMLGHKLTIIVLDNRGFGCIDRLQRASGSESFNNLLSSCIQSDEGAPNIDFASHARALGAHAEKVADVLELGSALQRARQVNRTCVIVIDTDPAPAAYAGGAWWDVPISEVSQSDKIQATRNTYIKATERQRR